VTAEVARHCPTPPAASASIDGITPVYPCDCDRSDVAAGGEPALSAGYREVPGHVDLVAMEHEVAEFWQQQDVFAASVARTAGGPEWTFYEGPPTANGAPGAHHVEARAFKDVFPRYRTMKGYHVPRRAGWDCHGLPVELSVEKELGFTGKGDIERYGIARFNERCRESVQRYVGQFTAMSERMGYWVDFDKAYWTMSPEFIDAVWWSLARIHERGLLVRDYRVSPYCPRCGTGLSDHEVAQGYRDVVDTAAFIALPAGGPLAQAHPGLALVVWTTTPWTLVANTAVAVNPNTSYVIAEPGPGSAMAGRPLIVADVLAEATLGPGVLVRARLSGKDLLGTAYEAPFTLIDDSSLSPAERTGMHTVIPGDFVTTEDGSGLVHLAPAFGAEDFAACRALGLPVRNPIQPDGTFEPGMGLVGGRFFKDAEPGLLADLAGRGLLLAQAEYPHSYPHCWRCHTPLMYYATPSWYIRTTAIKDALLRENEATDFYPPTIKHGRYGDWLANNVDWAISRDRYWGTPLPIWICSAGHQTAVESRAHLSRLTGTDHSGLDPHRPFVDEIDLPCPHCPGTATRVPQVIDCWYDSGAMPFAALGFPWHGAEEFPRQYPADFICEAVDQTRGWFYTLMAIGTLVFDRNAYRSVVTLGHILDESGRKMSKNLGNVLEPIPLMDEHGADAVRWFMLAAGSPWQSRRLGHAAIAEVVRRTLLTYWSTASFLSLYGRLAGFDWLGSAPALPDRPILDRWILARTARVAREVDLALAEYDSARAGRLLADLVDEVSNWYVRRTRRRFWEGDPAALDTLHTVLRTITLLMAPFTPFITERVWQDLFRPTSDTSAASVHLASWPEFPTTAEDPELEQQVALAQRLVLLGRAARAGSQVRTRQPLGRARVSAPGWHRLPGDLRAEVAAELNVESLESLDSETDLVEVSARPNFRALGRRFGNRTPAVAEAVSAASPSELAASLRTAGQAPVTLADGEVVEVTADEVLLTETPRDGWAVAAGEGETVALDLTLTEDLLAAGVAREAVRFLQEARKRAGFAVSDRIEVDLIATDTATEQALQRHAAGIAREVLAERLTVRVDTPADLADLADRTDAVPGSRPIAGGTPVLVRTEESASPHLTALLSRSP